MKSIYAVIIVFIFLPFTSVAQHIELINSGEEIQKGIELYDSGKYKQALMLYDQINRSDTNYVRALYEKALTCEADSLYEKAITYCREGLSLQPQREYEPELYNTYGNILLDIGKKNEAIKVFDEAIRKYPAFSLFYFNKGVVYLTSDRYDEAEQMFRTTLLINPYMYSAHYQLGIAALRQGKIIPAFLSFIGYLLVSPDGKYSGKSISLLNEISNSTDAIVDFKNKRTTETDEHFQSVEDIVLSKIALDKSYKPIIALDDAISRQVQAVFEKLEFKEESNDFWIQYYLPFYKQVLSEGNFEVFINHIFSNVNLKIIQEYNKKKRKELQAFVDEAVTYFNLLRSTRELFFKKRQLIDEKYFFENGNLIGKGNISNDGKILKGPWQFYYSPGNLKSIGQFNNSGGREGEWNYYFFSGKPKAKEQYKNGKLEGEQNYYFENGLLSSKEFYSNDQPNGLVTTYYLVGTIKSETHYKSGKKDGEEKEYYSNGNVLSVNNYSNGTNTGVSKTFYKSGQLKEEQHYVGDKLDGIYQSYYEDGSLNVQGLFVNDKAQGEWKYNYDGGKLKEKRNYVDNEQEGKYEEYYENGQLSTSYIIKKGKINGEADYYGKDGKIFSKAIFENGVVRATTYFNKSGNAISFSEGKPGSGFDITTYTEEGFKKSHYNVDKKGNLSGPDTLFYVSGKINQVNQYADDTKNGQSVTYYRNGNKKSEIDMQDGKENGYAKNYYFNGRLQSEGWFKHGVAQGEWNYYDEKGRLSSRANYLDGELFGYREEFLPNGKKTLEEKYNRGWLEYMTQFDSTGEKTLELDSFPQGSGKFVLRYNNGQKMIEADYVNGDFNGKYSTYFFDGTRESQMFYKKGLVDSIYINYYYGGIKNTEGQYNYGQKSGTWKFYDEDGKLLSTTDYVNDQANGYKKYFFPDGKTDFELHFKNDERDGISRKFENDGTLSYQTNYEEGDLINYTYLGKDGKLLPAIYIAASHVILKSYFPNGQLSRQCTFDDRKPNGTDILYYPNGQLGSIDTSAYGIYMGWRKEYYENGKLKSEYHYNYDNTDGVSKEYYEKGSLKKEINYDNGQYHGPLKYYNENGKLIMTKLFYYGKLISVKNEK